jgi:ABC-2 type transport system permease protein
MNVLAILFRREYWEHRKTFLVLPLVVAALCAFFMLAGIGSAQVMGEKLSIDATIETHVQDGSQTDHRVEEYKMAPAEALFGDQLQRFAELPLLQREEALNTLYLTFVAPLMLVLWAVIFMYFLTCLYDERKDRSILFWKSMPVSDAMTVGAKLLTGLVVVPAIYFVLMMALQLFLLLVSVLVAAGFGLDVWDTLVAPAHLLQRWGQMLVFMLFVALWCLPLFSWLVLVSSWARSVPLAWAIGVPVVVVIAEQLFTDSNLIWAFIGEHSLPGGLTDRLAAGVGPLLANLASLEFLASLVLAAVMLVGAVYFRSRADEF